MDYDHATLYDSYHDKCQMTNSNRIKHSKICLFKFFFYKEIISLKRAFY